MKRYEEAIKICKEGIEIARTNRFQNRYLSLMNILGSIYLAQNRLEKAEQQFDIILNYDYSGVSTRIRIDTLIFLAATYASMERWPEAEKTINDALKLARNEQAVQLSKVFVVAGNIYAAREKYSEAVTCYEEAENSANTSDNRKIQHLALLQLSHCFDKMGSATSWETCVKKLLRLQQEIDLQKEEDFFHAFV
ncbi:tetratricopeptide repeat protein [Thermoactinomyces mirandus]|uniref:Tetratricopeptide repeat protein n=1 Tax=Thermoactinomyces mirandus TaxID=2756294 RepID=A0A7W2ATH4_9BACL|nr:tetratricopeptide repeat protein [Thermoactinomyces mirandus]MBA4603516.1 tetratricopeptide repeat protein [Thermoactinomyces mirandus]